MMAAHRRQASSSLRALLDGVVHLAPEFERGVASLTLDSRQVDAGGLFFARRGTRIDAARFAPDVVRAGAAAMVECGEGPARVDERGLLRIPVDDVDAAAGIAAHRFFDGPSDTLSVIAVTGTNGKTSVCHMVATALEHLDRGPVGILGTLGRGIGSQMSDTGLTTPDCIALHGALAQFRDAGARIAVMEASSHALDQQRLAGVHVDTAVFTNLSRDHLDYHGDMMAYAASKARLFAMPGVRLALVNAADSSAPSMREAARDVPITTFALNAAQGSCDLNAELRSSTANGIVLEVTGAGESIVIESALIGTAAAWNLLTAFGVLRGLGVEASQAAGVLGQVDAAPGRMQTLGGEGRPVVVVDYSHTPAALSGALESLSTICEGALWCVFGAGGDRDPGKRPLMGEVAARLADRLVVTDDNPRGEDGDDIIDGILAGVPRTMRDSAFVERDRGQAIAHAVAGAGADDIVLIAGKGHETYQDVTGERRPFSDVAAARAALAEYWP